MNSPDQEQIHCPYCGEPTDVHVDIESEAADFVEDCTVCCRPILFHVERDETGTLTFSATTESE
jgi:hypothetical protein